MYLFLLQEQIYFLIQEIVNLPNNAFSDALSLKSSSNWPSSDSAFRFYTQCHVIQNHSTNWNQLTGTHLSLVYKHWANEQIERLFALPLQVLALWKTRFLTIWAFVMSIWNSMLSWVEQSFITSGSGLGWFSISPLFFRNQTWWYNVWHVQTTANIWYPLEMWRMY